MAFTSPKDGPRGEEHAQRASRTTRRRWPGFRALAPPRRDWRGAFASRRGRRPSGGDATGAGGGRGRAGLCDRRGVAYRARSARGGDQRAARLARAGGGAVPRLRLGRAGLLHGARSGSCRSAARDGAGAGGDAGGAVGGAAAGFCRGRQGAAGRGIARRRPAAVAIPMGEPRQRPARGAAAGSAPGLIRKARFMRPPAATTSRTHATPGPPRRCARRERRSRRRGWFLPASCSISCAGGEGKCAELARALASPTSPCPLRPLGQRGN